MTKFTNYTPCIVDYEAAMLVGHDIDTGKAYYDSDEVDAEIAALLARHNALVEAVAWEREAALHWEFGRIKRFIAECEALESMFSSRSEVDRLIAEREG